MQYWLVSVFEPVPVPITTRALITAARHWPSNVPGLARLRAGIASSLAGHQPWVRARLRGSKLKIVVPWNDSVGSAMLTFGDNEPHVFRFLRACFANRSAGQNIFVDVGANVGGFALRIAERFRKSEVIAYEPNPPIAELFRHNAESTGLAARIDIRTIAIGKSATTAALNVRRNDSGGATLRPGIGDDVPVAVRRLDQELTLAQWQRVVVLKVDVEGHELDVFRGATELLKMATPPIIFEVNCPGLAARGVKPQDLGDLLRSFGYCHFYGCGKRFYPIENGAYKISNVVALSDGSQRLIEKLGLDRNYKPPARRQLPVVRYRL